jgi:hypothetical protein
MSDSGTILGTLAIVISAISTIIGVINHKKIRSHCCGKDLDMSIDIDATTPPRIAPAPTQDRRKSIVICPDSKFEVAVDKNLEGK